MKDKNLDKKIKALKDYNSELDLDNLWKDLEPEIDALNDEDEKDRKPFFWWFLFGGIIAISSILIFTVQNTSKQEKETVLSSLAAPYEQTSKNETKRSQENKLLELEERDLSVLTPNGTETNKLASESTEIILDNSFDSQKRKVNKLSNKKIKTTPKLYKEEIIEASTRNNENSNKLFTNIQTTTLENKINPVGIKPLASPVLKSANRNLENVEIQQHSQFKEINLIKTEFQMVEPQNTVKPKLPIKKQDSEKATYHSKSKKPVSIFVGIEGGSFITNKKLSSQENSTYVQLREALETPLETVSTGLTIKAKYASGVYIKSGFQYTQINERLNASDTSSLFNEVYGLVAWQPNPYMNLNPIYDTIYNRIDTIRISTIYNRYKLYDLPINVGYEYEKGKWLVGLEAGVTFNLRLNATGQILNEQMAFINLNDAESTPLKSNVGLGWHMGLKVGYKINDYLHVYTSPKFRSYLQNFSKTESPTELRYQLLGIQLGVEYKIRN